MQNSTIKLLVMNARAGDISHRQFTSELRGVIAQNASAAYCAELIDSNIKNSTALGVNYYEINEYLIAAICGKTTNRF